MEPPVGEVVAGIDACKGGWIVIWRTVVEGGIRARLIQDLGELFGSRLSPTVIGIDIPIGLSEHGPRNCDQLARRLLKSPRSSNVFPAPVRAALGASSRQEASEINRRIDGRGVGSHAWGLYARVRSVDEFLQGNPAAQNSIYEVHPELAFMLLNGGEAVAASKKTAAGKSIRMKLVGDYFGGEAFAQVRTQFFRSKVQDDDILDAYAVLWSAERIRAGRQCVVPDPPQADSTGLRMGIWY